MVDKLSPRLAAVADQVLESTVLADVGTDHAQLPAWLLAQGRIETALALDVNEGPLRRARQVAAAFPGGLYVRKSDGLTAVKPGEVGCVSIAGMGGQTVADILRRGAAVWTAAERVIIQPQGMGAKARLALLAGGWGCVQACLVADRRQLYVVESWECAPNEPAWTVEDLRWGRIIRAEPDPLFCTWLQREMDDIDQGLQRLDAAGQSDHADVHTLHVQRGILAEERRRVT
jgi:tRNA (adenine22-N1)-methyltransferase